MLQEVAASQVAPYRQVVRARALLAAADGVANDRIAADLGVSPTTVRAWRTRFAEEGVARLGRVRSGRGRRPSIPAETVEAIVAATLLERPAGQTHWSCRTMAEAFGVSPSTVQRIWHARGLKPHLVETFKLSNDRRFEQKLVDVVGLYLHPPTHAVVLSLDEKTQIQALNRTQPLLPLRPGIPARQTHDYQRNGLTSLYAALEEMLTSPRFLYRVDSRKDAADATDLLSLCSEVELASHFHETVSPWRARSRPSRSISSPTRKPRVQSIALRITRLTIPP